FQLAVEAHEPPNRVAFRWLGGGLGEISDAPNNTVEFVIDPAGTAKRNLVRLTVRERGFAKLGLDEAVRRRNYEENLRGWEEQLEVARTLAEGGPREAADDATADDATADDATADEGQAAVPEKTGGAWAAPPAPAGERAILERWAGAPSAHGSATCGCVRGGGK